MYSKLLNKFLYFSIFDEIRGGQDAFSKREKAEETRWARRFVRL